ncbi:MAG: PorP/SprF family type IX secretion system membrane protein [Bacteroidia bacterium]|nr:PorP/SprF family type IX secretion system membrane protein [Bacteroidia bacterium]
MKAKNKKFTVIGVLSLTALCMFGQDVHFSQMQFAPMMLNPALAGANYANQGTLVYRDQWKKSDAQFTTINAGYDMRFADKKDKGFFGTGINFYNDKAGTPRMTTNYVALSLGYHVRLNKYCTLGGAAQPAFGQRGIDYTPLQWGSQYDGSSFNAALPNGEPVGAATQFNFFDINGGIVFTYKSSEHYMTANDNLNINVGFSAYHIAQPKYSFYGNAGEKLHRKYVFFANSLIGVPNSKLSFVPGVYVNIQGSQKEILAGTYFRYLLQDKSVYTGIKKGAAFSLGTFYRAGDAFVAKAMFEWSHMSMGFAYDMNLSSYTKASKGRGGFEICLRFVSPNPFGAGTAKSRI